VVCPPDAVGLEPQSVDLVFICDTYHHFEFPLRTMASIHRALRPGGQVVLIDFHRIKGKSSEWIMGHVRAGQEVFTGEVRACGFKQGEDLKFLNENYFVRFVKGEAGPQPAPAVRTFTYRKTPQAELALHVHYPPDWKESDRRPVVVFFFGGGWTQG